jgi:hypothetical protein
MRPEDYVRRLDERPGSLKGRQGAPPEAKDLFAQRMEATSAENRARIQRQRDLLAEKMDEIRNRADRVNTTNTNDSEES